MSKYIIEIEEKPLCVFDKDTQTYFPRLWRVKGFNSLVLDEEGLSRLKELTADYINEHFGSLQGDAYKRGLEDGKKEAESSEAIEQARADAFNKGMLFKEEKIHDAYKRGFEDGKWKSEDGCTGCKYEGKTGEHLPCDYCMNNFKNQWTAKDDNIEVGDEICNIDTDRNDTGIVTWRAHDDIYVMWTDGSAGRRNIKDYRKTGRHSDIASILEDMKHD